MWLTEYQLVPTYKFEFQDYGSLSFGLQCSGMLRGCGETLRSWYCTYTTENGPLHARDLQVPNYLDPYLTRA
jgi:hypothetical protein